MSCVTLESSDKVQFVVPTDAAVFYSDKIRRYVAKHGRSSQHKLSLPIISDALDVIVNWVMYHYRNKEIDHRTPEEKDDPAYISTWDYEFFKSHARSQFNAYNGGCYLEMYDMIEALNNF